MNKTRSLLVRFGALTLISTSLALLASTSVKGQITMDGVRDAAYGTPVSVQTVTAGWGAGNTLASLSAVQQGTSLHVFLAGRPQGNAFILFVDSKPGGVSFIPNNLITGGGEEGSINNFGSSTSAGMTFETGFEPDYAIRVYGDGGGGTGAFAAVYPLTPGASRSYIGDSGSAGGAAGAPVTLLKSVWQDVAGAYADATRGSEIQFSIPQLGVPSGTGLTVKMMAMLVNGGSDYGSNQVLGSLPAGSGDLAGNMRTTNFETLVGTQTLSVTVDNADADVDGIPDATDPDDDNDGLDDTVETNTGTFVSATDTGSNPLVADTDGDAANDGAEVSAGTNPNKKNYAAMLIAGDFLTPPWSDTPTADNTMSAVSGDEFGWQISRLFAAPTAIQFKFLGGSWSTNWGASATPGTASLGSGNISLQTGSGVFRIYFNTDTLAYSLTRATFGTYAEYAAAYGVTGGATDDDDGDGLTNQQEFAANTSPLAGDTDGDTLPDASEIDGSAATGTLGVLLPTNPLLADTDVDGLRDDWEISYFLNPTDDGSVVSYTSYIPADIGLTISANPNGGSSDPDNDLLTNLQEFSAGSSPLAAGTGLVANNSKITIPGAFNGWDAEGSAANTMVLTGNFTWKLLVYFAAAPSGGSFKFANGTAFGSPANKNWGAQIPSNGVAVLNGGDIDGSAVFTAAGYYAVNFNDFTLAYSLAPLAATDTDADGLPDEYEAFYGGQLPTPTTDLVPATDYNGDGKTTAQNYADGTNPVKDVAAPSVALAPGVDKVTWYAIGATIPEPIAADVVATDDNITQAPVVTILSPSPDNSADGFNTIIYQATDVAGNYTLFRRVIVVGSAAPGYYNLRYPAATSVNTSSSDNAYGEIFVANATPGTGQATGVQAWVGVNSANTDPSTWDTSAWTASSYVGDEGNNDNYAGVVSGVGRAPGTYYYATRFQLGTNSSNSNYFYGGITTNGVGNAWGSVTNTNNEVTTYGNGVLTVQAARQLTFAVNMNVQTNKSLFDPATQGVEVRGSFGGWAGGSALTNSNNSGIYTGTFVVGGNESSAIEYKFYRTGSNNAAYEGLANNRSYTLGNNGVDATVPTDFFNNDDGIGPVISLIGANPLNLNAGDLYSEPGATAFDAIEGSVTASPSGTVDTAVPGSYTITYNAADAPGNAATPVTRTVIVASANPYDSWSSQNGLTGADAQPTADPDKDGYTNRQEYAFGGDPKAGTAGLVQTSRSGSNLMLTWLQRIDSAAGYKVRSTANLAAGFTDDLTLTGQAENAASQDGVPQGYVRRQLSVAMTGQRNFLALAFD